VCLNILREDWKPVLSINSVIYGLQFLFLVRCHFRALYTKQRAVSRHIFIMLSF
jgi:ubiquitin-protein ligase